MLTDDRPLAVPRLTTPAQWVALNQASLDYDAMIHDRREAARQSRRFAELWAQLGGGR